MRCNCRGAFLDQYIQLVEVDRFYQVMPQTDLAASTHIWSPKKRAGKTVVLAHPKQPSAPLTHRFKQSSNPYAAAETGKLSKRNPKMISSTPIITAYQAMIQISAAAPESGFQKRRHAKMIEARPIRMKNPSPLISRRILIASAISVTPIINAHAAM